MSYEMIIAGQWGQGVMVAGKVLAQTVLAKGEQLTFLSFEESASSPQSNGCMAVIAGEEVTKDSLPGPGIAMVFDDWALAKIEPLVKKGGTLIIDISCVTLKTKRKDINLIKVPAREVANELGNSQMANMVMIGVLKAIKIEITEQEIMEGLKKALRSDERQFLLLNKTALLRGMKLFTQLRG